MFHRYTRGPLLVAALALLMPSALSLPAQEASQDKTWSVKADYIEACSCHLFCPCYFNTSPEGGMMCDFNNAIKITEGHVGDVNLDGQKIWLSGDLGGDFTRPLKSAVITLEPGVTPEQQKALIFIVGKIYPFKWQKVAVDKAPILWERNGMNGHARLGDGQGEIFLTGVTAPDGKPTVMRNLKYWGAKSNTGFYMARSTHRYKGHGHDYSFKDRNGFFIHIESEGELD